MVGDIMVTIEKEKCISCLACIPACPYGVIDMEGIFVFTTDTAKCNTCEEKTCKILCPTDAIF